MCACVLLRYGKVLMLVVLCSMLCVRCLMAVYVHLIAIFFRFAVIVRAASTVNVKRVRFTVHFSHLNHHLMLDSPLKC